MARNSTDDTDADELRRAFVLALSDSLKGEKVAAGTLDVVRRYLADQDQDRRWRVEQAQLNATSSAPLPGAAPSPVTTEAEAQAPATTPRIVNGVDLSRLPFPSAVKRRGVEHPPVKTTETTDSEDKPKDWSKLAAQPFMSPE
jgi:hypothetical protein